MCLVEEVRVHVADYTLPYPRETDEIPATVKTHPEFDYPTNRSEGYTINDIAILYLSKNVSSSRTIPLCSANYQYSTIATCGMGKMSGPEFLWPKVLQEAKLYEFTEGCDASISNHVCLRGFNNAASCLFDWGGPSYPLTNEGPKCLYGIDSYGLRSCDRWAVHTRIQAYLDWIEKNL